MAKRLYFAIQSRLERDDDGLLVASAGYARYEAWEGYLRSFDEVVLLARVEPKSTGRGVHRVEGPGLRVMEIPYYRGLASLIRRLPTIHRFLRRQLTDSKAHYGARLPDLVGLLVHARTRRLRAPFLAQVVGDTQGVLSSGAGGRFGALLEPVVTALLRHSVRSANAVIYVTRRKLQELYPAHPDALVLSRSNVELGGESIAAAPRDYQVQPPHTPFRIMTAGTQEQNYKGHDVLIKAVGLLNRTHPVAEVKIIGGGKYHSQLTQLAREQPEPACIHMIGPVSSAVEVRRHFADVDLFVLPSRTEGLPRVLIEAMASGIASIGSRVGGIPELLSEDWLFAPEDPDALAQLISELMQSPEELSRGARSQWREAKEIGELYSGQEILIKFLKRWSLETKRDVH